MDRFRRCYRVAEDSEFGRFHRDIERLSSGDHGGADRVLFKISDIVTGAGAELSRKRQRGRIYKTLMSGLERCRSRGECVRSMVLTLKRGVSDSKLFARWFQVLRKRIEHEFGFCLEYCSVLVDDGSRVHAHILFKVRSLVTGVCLGVRAGFIPWVWLRDAWFDITKHSYGVFLKRLDNNPKRLAHYFVAQYFSGQFGCLRLCYSWNWVFRGFCKVWSRCFAVCYAVMCKHGDVRGKSDLISAWNKVLRLDLFRLVRLFPFLRSTCRYKQNVLLVVRTV